MATALITGATRGIGAAIADELAATHDLILGGSRHESVDAALERHPDATGFACDLSDVDSIEQRVAELGCRSLDILVLSAGVGSSSQRVGDTEPAEWRRVLGLNVVAVAELTRQLLPALRAAQGQVIAINSGSGFHSGAGGSVYAASKFALRAFTDALREEERGQVRVSSIHPGRVDTDMQVELQRAAGRAYNPDDHLHPVSIAKAVRAAVDATPEAMVEMISVRPVVSRPTGKEL